MLVSFSRLRWIWCWIWRAVTRWQRRQTGWSLWACWRPCCWSMLRRGSLPQMPSTIPLSPCSTFLTSPTAISKSNQQKLLHPLQRSGELQTMITDGHRSEVGSRPQCSILNTLCLILHLTRSPLLSSVQSCFHIMDACQSRPNTYNTLNRNKALFPRPSTNLAGLPMAFSKMGSVRSQVIY